MINNERFFTYKIIIDKGKIIREGLGYKDVEISLDDIGKTKKITTGSLVYADSASDLFRISKYIKVGIYDDDIIWIPIILNDYRELISLLKSKLQH